MTEPMKHDWPKIISEIEAHITLYKLATMMNRQLVQVQRWQAGSEPRHMEGEHLLAIHAEYCADLTPVTVPSAQEAK